MRASMHPRISTIPWAHELDRGLLLVISILSLTMHVADFVDRVLECCCVDRAPTQKLNSKELGYILGWSNYRSLTVYLSSKGWRNKLTRPAGVALGWGLTR